MSDRFKQAMRKCDWTYLVCVLLSAGIAFACGEYARQTTYNTVTEYALILCIAIGGYGLMLLASTAPPWLWLRIWLLVIGNAYFAAVVFLVRIK